jgi:hypothetical protein
MKFSQQILLKAQTPNFVQWFQQVRAAKKGKSKEDN